MYWPRSVEIHRHCNEIRQESEQHNSCVGFVLQDFWEIMLHLTPVLKPAIIPPYTTEVAMKPQMTLTQLMDRFSSEDTCKQYLKEMRWPKAVRCPRCNNPKV